MTEREDTIERIERVLKLTNKESITVTIPRLTAERAVSLLKEQEAKEQKNAYENGFNDATLGKQELMYESTDGKWYKKDW